MRKWLARFLSRKVEYSTGGEDGTLALAGDAQRLRLELDERDRQVDALRRQLEKLHGRESIRVADAVQAQIEPFLIQAAAPAVQILTQVHLLEVQDRPVQTRDVLAVAKRLVRALQDGGLAFEGQVGDRVRFDPSLHEPLSTDAPIQPGELVEIKFVAASYREKLIQKAGVAPAGDAGRS